MSLSEAQNLSDEEIARRVQEGEADYFGILMERYEPKMMRYLTRFTRNRDDLRDIVQDVFIKVYKNIQSFDLTQRFSPWIYRIAHNEAINNIKKKVREPMQFFDPEMLFPHPVADENPQSDVERTELKRILEECMEDLDEKYKEVLVLRYFEDMDYKDIAEVLKVPVVTVGVRLNRGKVRLKEIYDRKYKVPVRTDSSGRVEY